MASGPPASDLAAGSDPGGQYECCSVGWSYIALLTADEGVQPEAWPMPLIMVLTDRDLKYVQSLAEALLLSFPSSCIHVIKPLPASDQHCNLVQYQLQSPSTCSSHIQLVVQCSSKRITNQEAHAIHAHFIQYFTNLKSGDLVQSRPSLCLIAPDLRIFLQLPYLMSRHSKTCEVQCPAISKAC